MVTPTAHTQPLMGAVDTHVHSSPDVLPRSLWDHEVVDAAIGAGMQAVVLKCHTSPTAARAAIANQRQDVVRVVGGVVLNHAVGGINPEAVRVSLSLGGRVVWMPTICAANHVDFMASEVSDPHLAALTSCAACQKSPIRIEEQGRLTPPVLDVLELLAEADAVLATGHLSSDESSALIRAARAAGVTRILVTHPEAPQIQMPGDRQAELADLGAVFERCYYSVVAGYITPSQLLTDARSTGLTGTVLATDLGQSHNPLPVDGFLAYRQALLDAGMTEQEWRAFGADNALHLLGIDPAKGL